MQYSAGEVNVPIFISRCHFFCRMDLSDPNLLTLTNLAISGNSRRRALWRLITDSLAVLSLWLTLQVHHVLRAFHHVSVSPPGRVQFLVSQFWMTICTFRRRHRLTFASILFFDWAYYFCFFILATLLTTHCAVAVFNDSHLSFGTIITCIIIASHKSERFSLSSPNEFQILQSSKSRSLPKVVLDLFDTQSASGKLPRFDPLRWSCQKIYFTPPPQHLFE